MRARIEQTTCRRGPRRPRDQPLPGLGSRTGAGSGRAHLDLSGHLADAGDAARAPQMRVAQAQAVDVVADQCGGRAVYQRHSQVGCADLYRHARLDPRVRRQRLAAPAAGSARVSAPAAPSDASARAGRVMHDTCGRARRAGRHPPCMPRKETGQYGERCAPIVELWAVDDKRPKQIGQRLPLGPRAACEHGHGLKCVALCRGHCQQQRHEVASPARACGSALPQQRAHRALPPKQCRVVRMGGAGCRHARETSPDVLRCAVINAAGQTRKHS